MVAYSGNFPSSLFLYELNNTFRSEVSKDATLFLDVIKWGLETPGGLALDWIHNLLFWTDSGNRRVEVATLDGMKRAVLTATDLDKPRAVAVHPGDALVFWTDWGKK